MGIDKKPGRKLIELHDGAVEAVNIQGGATVGIHGYPAHFHNSGEGEDVGNGFRVEIDWPEVWEITNHVGVLMATLRDGTDGAQSGVYVVKDGCVVKD